jgi:hypothetical protein
MNGCCAQAGKIQIFFRAEYAKDKNRNIDRGGLQ